MSLELALFIAALSVVTAGCLVPNRWLPPLPNDKLLHFCCFGVLAVLVLPLADNRSHTLWLLAGVLLAGLVIECLQQLVPDRRFCWRDMAANAGGVGSVTIGAMLAGAF